MGSDSTVAKTGYWLDDVQLVTLQPSCATAPPPTNVDLGVTVRNQRLYLQAGQAVAYTVTVSNLGVTPSSNARVLIPLPAGLASIDAVVLGETLESRYGRKLPFHELMAEQYAHGGTLTWGPVEAVASDDGTLGFTHGRWAYESPKAEDGTTRKATGSYVTVWRKQPDGAYKFALDIGNPDRPKESGD